MSRPKSKSIGTVLTILFSAWLCSCAQPGTSNLPTSPAPENNHTLRMAISPYQDNALIVNVKQTNLEKKYGIKLEFTTMRPEEILSSLASAGQTIDVSYALLNEYLIKSENLNHHGDDPIIFLYPIFVFKGGGFVSFNPDVPEINSQTINDKALVRKFLSYKIGTPKCTWSEMMLFVLAKKAGLKLSDLHYSDIPLSEGLLAAQNGSLDMTAAGLPQRNECLKRHGRIVFSMDTLGMGDIIGLVCKESVYKKRTKDIESFIKLWFDCADYSLSDIDHHCNPELAYLKANASTQYTVEEFKKALSLEYFPKNLQEVKNEIVSPTGKYSIDKQTVLLNQYLIDIGAIKTSRPTPKIISLN